MKFRMIMTLSVAAILCVSCGLSEPLADPVNNSFGDSPSFLPLATSNATFGIYTETYPSSIQWDVNAKLDIWNGMTIEERTDVKGEGVKSAKLTGTGSWMGMGIRVHPSGSTRDLSIYSGGYLRFMVKASKRFKVGLKSGGSYPVEKWIVMNNGSYGFYADNIWRTVSIPLSAFAGVDLSRIEQFFMWATDSSLGYTTGSVYYVDHIHFFKTVTYTTPAPDFDPAKAFVLYAETIPQNVVWGSSINTNQSPSSPNVLSFVSGSAGEGSQCFKIKVNSNVFNVNWLRYPLITYLDGSGFANGTLRFMIRARKGIAVGIHMAENYDIMVNLTHGLYGFRTDNTWCSVVIPISEFVKRGVDLTRLYGYLKFYGGYYQGITGGEEYFIDKVYFYKQ